MSALMIVLHGRAHTLAFDLTGEWYCRGRTTAGGGYCAGCEIVGHDRAVTHRLIEVAMGVNTAGRYQSLLRINDLRWLTSRAP